MAIGDIGVIDGMMHIGDEAMFEEFVVQARARGIHDIVAISSNPAETSERYGLESVPRGEVTLAGADALVITGAGNLASTWPAHIAERLSLARQAEQSGIPLVVTGQTLGPYLTVDDSAALAELLLSARLVGARESASHALATRLGVPGERLHLGADDASFLGLAAAEHPAPGPFVLVSLSTHVGAADRHHFVSEVAALLDHLAAVSGVEIVFLAHFGPLSAPWPRGDVVMHEAVAASMTSPTRTVPTGSPLEAAQLARTASLVVTSRYHPAVFAVPVGVPTLGIAVDDYTTVKLRGALGNFGQDSVLAPGERARGAELATRLWGARHEIRARGHVIAEQRRGETDQWWNRVAQVIAGE